MIGPRHIHITGASGSGTTTLGRALAGQIAGGHYDTDDYYWLPSDPPYSVKRNAAERLGLLGAVLIGESAWVVTGSLVGWGDPLVPRFDLVVFLTVPKAIRIERLRAREIERYGSAALAPGGRMHEQHRAFLSWAASYDDGSHEGRSRTLHEAWLAHLPCPVVRVDGNTAVEAQIPIIMNAWRQTRTQERTP